MLPFSIGVWLWRRPKNVWLHVSWLLDSCCWKFLRQHCHCWQASPRVRGSILVWALLELLFHCTWAVLSWDFMWKILWTQELSPVSPLTRHYGAALPSCAPCRQAVPPCGRKQVSRIFRDYTFSKLTHPVMLDFLVVNDPLFPVGQSRFMTTDAWSPKARPSLSCTDIA